MHTLTRLIPSIVCTRLIVTLDSNSLTIDEPSQHDTPHLLVWPLEQVGTIYPNRYCSGVYVTITGRDSFDLISDCPHEVVKYVGETLERTLAALRAKASSS